MRRLLLFLVLALVGTLVVPTAAPAASSSEVTLIVTTSSPDVVLPVPARPLAQRVSAVQVPARSATATAAALAAAPGVVDVQGNGELSLLRAPNDARYPEQWAHAATGIETAWGISTGASSVVAVLDSGIAGGHPDLAGKLRARVDVSSGAPVVAATTDTDTCGLGHGTEVAGVLAATTQNGRDVAGSGWDATIVDVVLTGQRTGCRVTDAALLAGLGYVATRGDVDVVNLSLGRVAPACPTALQAAIDDLVRRGVTVVAAAGNLRTASGRLASVPASCNGVISVGAVGQDGAAASYTPENRWIDLLAPGGDDEQGILTLGADLSTRSVMGSSYAAAYVTGVVALLRDVRPAATPAEVEALLEGTAADYGPTGRDDLSGWGTLQAAAAVQAAKDGAVPAVSGDESFPVADLGPVRLTPDAPGGAIGEGLRVSRTLFGDREARHVVLARADDYADALAGSALAGAAGPVLLTNRDGALPAAVRDELARVLPPGGRAYLLGGTSALPAGLEGELRSMGFDPVRLAGTRREETSALVAPAVLARRAELGLKPPTVAVLATARNWPDATVAASIAALTGAPVLVTAPDGLDPAVADAIARQRPSLLYVLGGTAAVSEATADHARRAGGIDPSATVRLAGTTRTGTALAVAAETSALVRQLTSAAPTIAVAVNVRRGEGFGYVLVNAPLVGASTGVFIPVEGEGGTELDESTVRFACRLGARSVLAGGADVVADHVGGRLPGVLAGTDGSCQR